MAKLTVEYQCGHTVFETRFGGKYEEQLERAKELDCPDCYKARKAAERERKNAEVRASVQDLPLAELSGSPKQVAWANDLRAHVLAEVREHISPQLKKPEDGPKFERLLIILAQKPEAKWWIEHRDRPALQLAANVAKEEGLIPGR